MKHILYQPFKRGLLLLVLIAGALQVTAQDAYLLSQQWQSRLNRNPAAAGVSGNQLDLAMFYRNQWGNLDDALHTTVLNAEGYVPDIKSNLGFTFSYDKPTTARQNVSALVSYAFRFDVSAKYKLSLGLAAGIMNRSFDPGKLVYDDPGDPGKLTEKTSTAKADFSAGAELTGDKLTVGLGITHLGNSTGTGTGNSEDWLSQQQVYTYARYLIPAAHKFDVVPAASWLHYEGDNLFELGVSGLFDKKYWAGVAWRPDAAVVLSAGLEFYLFRVGYAYDLGIGDSKVIDGGVHEVMVQFSLNKSKAKAKPKAE